jgi:hypothetical protein
MKYTVEMGLGAVMYIPSLIKIGSGIQKLIGGIHRDMGSKVIAYAYFFIFKIKKNRLRMSR